MKKIKILLAILLLAGLSTQAQSGWLATATLPGDIENTIIRQYQDEQAIVYVKTSAGCYFAWSDNQNMVRLFGIDCKYTVNDFEIYEDTVCFCGHYFNGTDMYGLVGWFCVPDLLAGTDSFHIFYDRYWTTAYGASGSLSSYVTEFNDLTIFEGEEPDSLHVALVGKTHDGEATVVELRGQFLTNTWSYTSGTSHPDAGTLEQVAETDNYIVVGGIGLAIDQVSTVHRAFTKFAMFPSASSGDNLYRYTGGSSYLYPNCNYPVGSFKMTAVDSDKVATTSLFLDIAPSYPNLQGFVTHIVDARDFVLNPIGSPCYGNALVYVANTAGYCSVNSLIYSGTKNFLASLVRSNNPLTGNGSVIGELTYTTAPPAPSAMNYSTVLDYYFHDHDNYFAQAGYIASGKSELAPTELAIYTQMLGNTAMTCGQIMATTTKESQFHRKDHTEYPLGIYPGTFLFGPERVTERIDLELKKICREP